MIVVLAVLTFVPSKYLYPSQPGRLNQVATAWACCGRLPGLVALELLSSPAPRTDPSIQRLAVISLFYPVFYLGASWVVTLKYWRKSVIER